MNDSAADKTPSRSPGNDTSSGPAPRFHWRDLLPVTSAAVALLIPLGTALALGFAAGMGWYKLRLEMTQQDEVPRGSYVLKKNFHGIVLTTQAWTQLTELIENSNREEPASWLLDSKTFVSGLDLPKDTEVVPPGQPDNYPKIATKVSTPLSYIFYAQSTGDLDAQVKGTLGILKGLRRLYQPTQQ